MRFVADPERKGDESNFCRVRFGLFTTSTVSSKKLLSKVVVWPGWRRDLVDPDADADADCEAEVGRSGLRLGPLPGRTLPDIASASRSTVSAVKLTLRDSVGVRVRG